MSAANGIVGDESISDLPQTFVPEKDLSAERNAARFSRTVEFKRLKEHLEQRIEYYQMFLPDGRAALTVPTEELAQEWKVANTIITEFKMVIGFYEQAKEIVADADRRSSEGV